MRLVMLLFALVAPVVAVTPSVAAPEGRADAPVGQV